MEWTKNIPEYATMPRYFQEEVKRLFEMTYGSIMGRCWVEVRKLWLEHITFSTSSIIGKVAHVFFRNESDYQIADDRIAILNINFGLRHVK